MTGDLHSGKTRHRLDAGPDGEVLTIPSRFSPVRAVLVAAWLAVWTLAGLATIGQSIEGSGHWLYLGVSALVWGVAWLAGGYSLVYMLSGRQVFRFDGPDLEVILRAPGLSFRRSFRGAEIRQLSAIPTTFDLYGWRMPKKYLLRGPSGGIRFVYGMGTRDIAADIDEAESAAIIAWLKRRLPEA